MLSKYIWYYRRLKTMSAPEVLYRIKNTALFQLEKRGHLTVPEPPAPNISRIGATWAAVPTGLDSEAYVKQANQMAVGIMDVFTMEDANLGNPPEWNRDPLTGTLAPSTYGKSMNYRDETIVGDIKYLWEPNRHLQLVRLAQAYALSGGGEHLDSLRSLLLSWFEQCPYLIGPNWISSLELSIRLINWSLVWQYVGGLSSPLFEGNEGQLLLGRWMDSVYQHVHFVDGHYSRFSSANNHLIGEAAGVVVASKTWPFWDDFARYDKRATAVLEEEMLRQNHSDGVNAEQAVSYQQFVLDFAITAGLACKAAGTPMSTEYWRQVERMVGYLAALMDAGGNMPMFGDADDGYVVDLSPEANFCPYHSLLDTGAILFSRENFRSTARKLDHKTLWLLGDDSTKRFEELKPKVGEPCSAFQEGGYYILGHNFHTMDEIKAVVDCGPLGYLSIAAHGHADALAIYLSAGGRELLVDPGTYAYHTNQKWRDYFRGTSAHNTVRVDGVDQSVIGGNFMWHDKANATLLEHTTTEGKMIFRGYHDGYTRLENKVNHEREVRFEPEQSRFMVKDTLTCKGAHVVERFWHCHEDCAVEQVDGWIVINNGASWLRIRAQESDTSIEIIREDEERPLGWVSRRFDTKVPSYTVMMTDRIKGNTELSTEMLIEICSDNDY